MFIDVTSYYYYFVLKRKTQKIKTFTTDNAATVLPTIHSYTHLIKYTRQVARIIWSLINTSPLSQSNAVVVVVGGGNGSSIKSDNTNYEI